MKIKEIYFKYLPDVHSLDSLPKNIIEYGRCAILNDNTFWIGNMKSSHPLNTNIGFYYALTSKGNLVISARSNFNDYKKYITNDFVKFIKKYLS